MVWTPDQPLVRLADVHKNFGTLTVLKGVSMDVMKGEVICIIGPSGSGKSTLLRCVNALVPIDRGSILVEGQEVNDPKLDKLALRRKVGMVFQQYNLFPHKTALENVMMAPIHVLKRDRRREVEHQALARRSLRAAGKGARRRLIRARAFAASSEAHRDSVRARDEPGRHAVRRGDRRARSRNRQGRAGDDPRTR
jgi:polar amino acid transport system ATP-binding protein